MAKTEKTQLAILGAGPGGYVAAFHAADLGLDVTLVDLLPRPGGVCLYRGCIPSKALLRARGIRVRALEAASLGLRFAEPEIDLDQLRNWKNGIIEKLTKGLMSLAKARKVRYIQARGRFIDSGALSLEAVEGGPSDIPERLEFEKAILASGSSAVRPKLFQVDDPRVMGSREALEIPDIPGRMLVVGGGYIGLELGQFYAGMGARVSVVEMMDQLLPATDPDLVKPLERRLKKEFEKIYLKTTVKTVEPRKDGVRVVFEKKEGGDFEDVFDRLLVAVGRRPNSADLGLENTQVRVNERGFVEADARMQTADPRVLAIGDVVGGMMLAHKASHEGKVAAAVVAGNRDALSDAAAIPAVVYTDPEIASCGLTELAAEKDGRKILSAKYPWGANGRALVLDQAAGFTKLLADPETRRVLGMGIVGEGAGDMIAEGVLAIEMGAVAEDLAMTIHAHPTLCETIGEAAEKIFGKAIHSLT
jgi:dihydrolipoamide dehydrogenase